MKKFITLLLVVALVFTMVACNGGGGGATEAPAADGWKDGTYTGESAEKGFAGEPLKVEVVVKDGKIASVTPAENGETPNIGGEAMTTLSAQIVEKNGTDGIESVSGATMTEKPFLEAVNKALESAK